MDGSRMSRSVVDARIQDRTSRGGLAVRNKPYWRVLSEGAHLGYRRGKLKGSWVVRYRVAENGDYVTGVIGEADDLRDADGVDVLDNRQAFDKALRWFELQEKGGAPSPGANTVARCPATCPSSSSTGWPSTRPRSPRPRRATIRSSRTTRSGGSSRQRSNSTRTSDGS